MRLLLIAATSTVALALAGCGSSGGTELTIHIENAWGVKNYTLTCDPPGGDVPDATQMCERLSANAEKILFAPPNNRICVGGMNTIHVRVTGRFEGRAVDTKEADACEGNSVAENLWQSSLVIPLGPS